MKRSLDLLIAFILFSHCLSAQQPVQLIAEVYKNFQRLRDYSADVKMDFNIPSVNMKSIQGRYFLNNQINSGYEQAELFLCLNKTLISRLLF